MLVHKCGLIITAFDCPRLADPTELRKPVLQGISFVVEPGKKVALVGPTGCGKSSCMSLLQRLYEPQQGTILIDDVPISEYDVHYLRSRVVIVDQHTVLFSATIRDNITFGMEREVTDDEVVQACKDARAWDFVDEMPDKLMTWISAGSNLSGGQRQRLAIARAIIRKPDVILLDEATSALDNENEAKVQTALDELARCGSALIIAHRLSTIKDSDTIVVVDHGRAVEAGTHDDLMSSAEPLSRSPSEGSDEVPPAPRSAPRRMGKTDKFAKADDPHGQDPQPLKPRRMKTSPAFDPSTIEAMEALHKPTSYKKLWNAATGGDEKLSLSKMQAKIAQMERELSVMKSKHSAMLERKQMLMSCNGLGSEASSDGELDASSVPFGAAARAAILVSRMSGIIAAPRL